jgi:NAD dependent epimerase/dehydratase family enzyme
MSWVHVRDVVGIALEALTNEAMNGPVNATAPDPVRNREFSKTLGRVLHRPAVMPTPVLGLKLMFGEFAEILATGQRVVPAAALEAGYRFSHPDLESALRSAV